MAKRKTMNVETFKDQVNNILASMPGDCAEKRAYRKGIMTLLEDVLFETGNYSGFQYLGDDKVPTGCAPGIHWDNIGDYEKSFANTDQTRVMYF